MPGIATQCMLCGESTAYDDSNPYNVVACKDCDSTACGDCHKNGYCLSCRECPPLDIHSKDQCSAIHPNETHDEWWSYQCDLSVDTSDSKVIDLSFG
jgi:hypothetical protein